MVTIHTIFVIVKSFKDAQSSDAGVLFHEYMFPNFTKNSSKFSRRDYLLFKIYSRNKQRQLS